MPDFIYENVATGALHKLSGTPPVDPAGKIPGGAYRVYLPGAAAPVIAQVPDTEALNIVCWGDSLTAGAGAPLGDYYPEQAALLLPGRSILRRGVGGQNSAQIAARQGGMPILVDHAGIPAWEGAVKWAAAFASNRSGLSSPGTGDSLNSENGILRWITNTAVLRSITLAFSTPIPAGSVVRIRGKIANLVVGGVPVTTTGIYSAGVRASSTWTGGSFLIGGSIGEFEQLRTITADATDFTIAKAVDSPEQCEIALEYLEITVFSGAQPTAALTAKNINTLVASGTYTGSMVGRLAGVPGTITTDASGNWTFTRTGEGPAVAAATNAPFVISEVDGLRSRTAWLWPGRNDAGQTDLATRVQTALDAMISYMGHDRYLVGSILNQDSEPSGNATYNRILAKNADLASRYGRRYVDVKAALMAAADPVRDAQWIAADIVPLAFRSDNVHLNAWGYSIAAKAFVAAHKAMGW